MRKPHVLIACALALAAIVWCQCGGQQGNDDKANDKQNGENEASGPGWSEKDDVPSGTTDENVKAEPAIKQTGEDTYVLDGIELNTKTKTVQFEAVVNQTDQDLPLEVLVCTDYGKTHESLLRTTVSPTYLNVAFKLIGCHEGKPRAGAGDPNMPVGSALEIEVKWTDKDGKVKAVEPESWIWARKKNEPLADTTWTYLGSMFHMNRFMAEATGTIVNLYTDPSTLIEPPIDEIDDDEALGVYEKVVPPIGTKVELIFTLVPEKEEAEKPADGGQPQ